MASQQNNDVRPPTAEVPPVWVQRLQRLGLANMVAALLESHAGLGLVGAQAVHIGTPLLSGFLDEGRLHQAADTLEDPRQLQAFIDALRSNQP